MRKKEGANIFERIKLRLLTFGDKDHHSTHSSFLQFQVDWVKSNGTGTDGSVFKGALHQDNPW